MSANENSQAGEHEALAAAQAEISRLNAKLADMKQGDEEIARIQHEQSTLMNDLPGVLYRTRRVPGNTVLEIVFVSAGFEALTGYTASQVLSDSTIYLKKIVHPKDRRRVVWEVESALRGRQPFEITYRIITVENVVRWVSERAMGFYEKNTLVGREGLITDVTHYVEPLHELRRDYAELSDRLHRQMTQAVDMDDKRLGLEQQVRRSQCLETLGALSGGVAHDFNNLMQAVIGYAQRLMASSPPPTGDTRHYVECIRDSALRASDLTDLLLAFCRKNEQPPSITMLEPVLQEAARMLRASLPATVELTVDLHPLSTPVLVSSVQLVEVIITLALKVLRGFGTESGRLYITLDEIEVKDDLPTHVLDKLHHGRYALIHIGDSSSVIDALFPESPRDLSNERTQRPSASDFDVIQNILLELGGALTMRSPLHKGRLYTLYLPLASDAETPTTPRATGWDEPRRSETQGHGEHILFVDDEQMLAELGKLVGEEHSYNVTTHTVSIEALEAFAADPEKYDLVITDQTMPGMTGFDLAQKMLAIRPDLPIVLTTGYSAIIDEARAMSIGIKAYLMKPITPETLAETIHGLLEG